MRVPVQDSLPMKGGVSIKYDAGHSDTVDGGADDEVDRVAVDPLGDQDPPRLGGDRLQQSGCAFPVQNAQRLLLGSEDRRADARSVDDLDGHMLRRMVDQLPSPDLGVRDGSDQLSAHCVASNIPGLPWIRHGTAVPVVGHQQAEHGQPYDGREALCQEDPWVAAIPPAEGEHGVGHGVRPAEDVEQGHGVCRQKRWRLPRATAPHEHVVFGDLNARPERAPARSRGHLQRGESFPPPRPDS